MPRSLTTDNFFPVVLESDKQLPEDDQPFFLFRPLTMRECREALKVVAKVSAVDETNLDAIPAALDSICNVLKGALIGWGNMYDGPGNDAKAIDYDPEQLDMLIDLEEGTELLGKLIKSQHLSPEDKKKFGSLVTSGKRRGAKAARRGSA